MMILPSMQPSTLYILTLVVLPAVFVIWTLSSTSNFAQSYAKLFNKRICLLIAHPDDEAMFFSPMVLALTRPELGNHLKILCLSTGRFTIYVLQYYYIYIYTQQLIHNSQEMPMVSAKHAKRNSKKAHSISDCAARRMSMLSTNRLSFRIA